MSLVVDPVISERRGRIEHGINRSDNSETSKLDVVPFRLAHQVKCQRGGGFSHSPGKGVHHNIDSISNTQSRRWDPDVGRVTRRVWEVFRYPDGSCASVAA